MISVVVLCSGMAAGDVCDHASQVLAIKGTVETKTEEGGQWHPARPDTMLCPGHMVRTGALGSVTIKLHNGAAVKLDQNALLVLPGGEGGRPFLTRLLQGAALFFSQQAMDLKIDTPFATAAVDGTQFLVTVLPGQSRVTVYSGRVNVANAQGRLVLEPGQSARALEGKAPAGLITVRPKDAVQWALYYPPLSDVRLGEFLPPAREIIQQAMAFRRDGRLVEAVEVLERIPVNQRSSLFYACRAELFLFAGRVEKARADIERLRPSAPALALSLLSIIATAQNRKKTAITLSENAVSHDPGLAAAWSAQAYARQAVFDLKGALESQEKAVALDPENALLWARLAQLQLASGDIEPAGISARKAVALNPDISRTQTVLGYTRLTGAKIQQAMAAFETAIRLDQTDPLPRLGLGLAMIRRGQPAKGRQQMETALGLDPNNALVRSYLGKAFDEEHQDKPAEKQFNAAKKLDPNDPTPWLYSALHKQADNRPVEALEDLQKSIELNDNRAVYRSRFLLDQDLASRSAGLARIYDVMGFGQLALLEGYKSLSGDPDNYSAHRFLADAYDVLPRHEIARVSELLQSQLLSPVTANPVQPQLADATSAGILDGTWPSKSSLNEYTSLFERNRLDFQVNGVAGSNNTRGEEMVHYGLWDHVAYSLGQYHYATDGFKDNNDLEKDMANAFFHMALTPETSVQLECRYDDRAFGFLAQRIEPSPIDDTLRQYETTRLARLGVSHELSRESRVLGSVIFNRADYTNTFSASQTQLDAFNFGIDTQIDSDVSLDEDSVLAEIQHRFQKDRISLISGIGYYDLHSDEKSRVDTLVTHEVFGELVRSSDLETSDSTTEHVNGYAYLSCRYPDNMVWHLGLSLDSIDSREADEDKLNPKIGLTWTPGDRTTVRGAMVRTVVRSLVSGQTIEPTQVAGFNQFYSDNTGTVSELYGMAVDHRFSRRLYAGMEILHRENDTPLYLWFDEFNFGDVIRYQWEETVYRCYVFKTLGKTAAVSAEYFFERQKSDDDVPDPEAYLNIKTHRIPLGLGFFHPSGFLARLKASYFHQDYRGATGNEISDQFWVVDAQIGWRFQDAGGSVSIVGTNIFDKTFEFQDTDPFNPRINPERQVFVSVSWHF